MPIWQFTVTKIPPKTNFLKSKEEVEEFLLATWETSLGGVNWLTAFVDAGKSTLDKSGGNHSWRFVAEASTILPVITAGHPEYQKTWICSNDQKEVSTDFLSFSEKLQLWPLNIAKCLPRDRLTIDAWGNG
ncbi:MAG: hypothetical protein EOP14_04810 [Pseudomonas sp.]|nr:MAG: hypothetical protein EOP14_04810 [Pseudomonas sp.]